MEIIFLGTGGGRVNLIRQVRKTGGFRINSKSAEIHVDPGPGALINSCQYRIDPLKLDAIIVTHAHIDHCNDANLMIEGMSKFALEKKGILIASANALGASGDTPITKYHQKHCNEVYSARFGERKKFRTWKGEFDIEIIKVDHDETSAFGFKLYMDGKIIGYTSDTNWFEALGERFAGCDVLVVNCLKPFADGIPDHLETRDVIKLLKIAKPRLTVLSHFGMKMLRSDPDLEAKKIEHDTEVETLAGEDGMKIVLGKDPEEIEISQMKPYAATSESVFLSDEKLTDETIAGGKTE